MDIIGETVYLTDDEPEATLLPETFPWEDAGKHANYLWEHRIPELSREISDAEHNNDSQLEQRELPHKYKMYYSASSVAHGITRELLAREPAESVAQKFQEYLASI